MPLPRPEELGFTPSEENAIKRVEESVASFLTRKYNPEMKKIIMTERDRPSDWNNDRVRDEILRRLDQAGWDVTEHGFGNIKFVPKPK